MTDYTLVALIAALMRAADVISDADYIGSYREYAQQARQLCDAVHEERP